MRVAMTGTGDVDLASGACFAELGDHIPCSKGRRKSHGSIIAKFNLRKRLKDFFYDKLPLQWQGRLDYRSGHHQTFYPWGGPFNDQTARREICRKCFEALMPDLIVETGTYRGTTTEFFAQFDCPVISIESNIKFFEFSRLRLEKFRNCKLYLGSSETILDEIFEHIQKKYVFAYLDAHWNNYLPLNDEISSISKAFNEFIILIDDFKVPHDAGYRYDDYGKAGACTQDFIQESLSEDMEIFYPKVPSKYETGKKRGYCFIARGNEQIAMLETIPELVRSF